jgi:hypothetical protein
MPRTDIYHPDAFSARVEHAIHCLVHDQMESRDNDTCYEMFDGDAVVTAILRRAATNPRLRASFAKHWRDTRDGLPVAWIETAEKYAHIPTEQLPELAREMRDRAGTINAAPAPDGVHQPVTANESPLPELNRDTPLKNK